jgi:cytochrome c5
MRLLHSVLMLIFALASCSYLKPPVEIRRKTQAPSTFAKFLKSAEAGDAKIQNLIGFMLYYGENAPKDREAAHRWFHRAADQGNASAQLNIAVMHYLGAGIPKDLEEAASYFELAKKNNFLSIDLSPGLEVPESLPELAERAMMRPQNHESAGELTYVTFCAGCHGFNGIAGYVRSPSFALGERMEKNDEELFQSIMGGHDVMPRWDNKLPSEELKEALRFARSLQLEYQHGILHAPRPPPARYFLFGPRSLDKTRYVP